jgi:hypothetical protein
MATRAARPAIDLAPQSRAHPRLALALALLSIPGVTVAWDIGTIGGPIGVAVAIAAVALGLQSRSRLAGAKGTLMANVAIGIASAALLSVVVFLIIGAPE